MSYIILKGDNIVQSAHTLPEAKIAAKQLLPKGYKKGDHIRPSLQISIYKFINEYGGL